jgi:hypothetical protein
MRRLLSCFREYGFDPIKFFRSLVSTPRFILEVIRWKSLGGAQRLVFSPALNDYRASSGSADGHYFWQDLVCAKWIFENRPNNHFDVGSRVDGFIAHLLSFMQVKQLDIRPVNSIIPNLSFLVGDAQKSLKEFYFEYESVSSLHSIEHFGLGRYGDSLDSSGHIKGLQEISKCTQIGGILYVSFPIGEPRVEFNSQRVIHPNWPIEILTNFKLDEFVLIPWKGAPIYGLAPADVETKIRGQAGLYRFVRIS